MITIDIQPGRDGKASINNAATYSTLRITDGVNTVTVYFEAEAVSKAREAAKLINEAFLISAPATLIAAE